MQRNASAFVAIGLLLMLTALATPGAAQGGTVTTGLGAPDLAQAMYDWRDVGALVDATGAGLDVQGGTATALADMPAGDGGPLVVLSTGAASDAGGLVPRPSTDRGEEGPLGFDEVRLRVRVVVPEHHDCLAVRLQFLTSEAGTTGRTADRVSILVDGTPTGPADAGLAAIGGKGIGSTGPALDARHALGTPFLRGTPVLMASAPVTPGLHEISFSLWDGQDGSVDSVLLLDGLTSWYAGNQDVRTNAADGCVPGAHPMHDAYGFTWAGERTCAPVRFQATGRLPADAVLGWDMRDGDTSTRPAPQHHFAAPGTYNVTLVVREASGAVQEVRQAVTIIGPCPVRALPGSDYTVADGQTIRLQGRGTGGIGVHTCHWDLGFFKADDKDRCDPQVEALQPGRYPVLLTVRDEAGNQASNETTIQVLGPVDSMRGPDDPRRPHDVDAPRPNQTQEQNGSTARPTGDRSPRFQDDAYDPEAGSRFDTGAGILHRERVEAAPAAPEAASHVVPLTILGVAALACMAALAAVGLRAKRAQERRQ